ncbi:MAG: hypothetical protein AB7W16_21365 [Candidatus Obscuribacterales bacterium]
MTMKETGKTRKNTARRGKKAGKQLNELPRLDVSREEEMSNLKGGQLPPSQISGVVSLRKTDQ